MDLYINGIKQYSGKVAPGPFQLNSAPTITGSGDAQVVLTDALGRSTVIDFPFYTTENLLEQGLSDWSAELGVVRQGYGQKSFDYGHQPTASGTWRYGVSNSFTTQTHAEAIAGVANAGLGGTWLLGTKGGVVSASFALSHARGKSGDEYNLGYQWQHGRFNFSVGSIRTNGDYRDVASLYGAPPPSISERALVGLSTALLGNFSLSYLHLGAKPVTATRPICRRSLSTSTWPARPARIHAMPARSGSCRSDAISRSMPVSTRTWTIAATAACFLAFR